MLYFYVKGRNIKILYENKSKVIKSSSNKFLNELCIKNLSTLKGRIESISSLFDYKYKTPIYISHKNLMFPIFSDRNYENFFINYFEIEGVLNKDENSIIIFFKDRSLIIHNRRNVLTQIERCEKILEYISNL